MTSEPEADPIPRPTSRLLLLDPGGRLLLFRAQQPDAGTGRPFWFPAGGGVEAGETFEACAIRELYEETGIEGVALGPVVWTREVVGNFAGVRYRFDERYFVARLTTPAQISTANHTVEEVSMLAEYRWWAIEEIAASTDIFVPRELVRVLPPVIAGELPATPLRVL